MICASPRQFAVLLSACLAVTAVAAGKQPDSSPAAGEGEHPAAYVAVLDFAGDEQFGRRIADSVRLRLRRHEEYFVIDRLTTQDASGPVAADAERHDVVELMKTRLGANLAIYGSVSVDAKAVTLDARCVDLTDPNAPTGWSERFSDGTQRAEGLIARRIVERVRGREEWTPPQYGDTPVPEKFGRPLNANGGFDRGPTAWQMPDNCASFLIDDPRGSGKVLKIRTDLPNDPWVAYHRKLRLGQADPNHPPKLPPDTSYGSVAGLEGVHFNSDFITATPGWRYWLVADAKKPGPKIFVKGYEDWSDRAEGMPESSLVELGLSPGEFAKIPEARRKRMIAVDARRHPERYRRECWRWYLNLAPENARSRSGEWMHFAEPFPPRGGMPEKVEWLQIQVYAYWPPGTYYFDNVHVYRDPSSDAPVAPEPARTPNFGRTSDVVEAGTATRPADAE